MRRSEPSSSSRFGSVTPSGRGSRLPAATAKCAPPVAIKVKEFLKGRTELEPARRRTRAVRVGALSLGGGAPVRIQSMTKTDTNDVGATVRQVRALERAGCARSSGLAVPGHDAVASFAKIRARVTLPLVADIHFDHRLAIACIDAGADKVRINPGNIGGTKRLQEVARRAGERGARIGSA